MKHLSREELIDSLEQMLPPPREAHVDVCEACRAERAALRQVLGRVKAVDVPEPSPLFWTHFTERVRDAVARQPQPLRSAWPAWPVFSSWNAWNWRTWAAGAATLVVCVMLGWSGLHEYQRRHPAGNAVAVRTAAATTHAPAAASVSEVAIASDEDWNLVVRMAEDVTIDDTDEPEESAMVVRPGAADRVMADLSSEQRSELARILTAEMARPAS